MEHLLRMLQNILVDILVWLLTLVLDVDLRVNVILFNDPWLVCQIVCTGGLKKCLQRVLRYCEGHQDLGCFFGTQQPEYLVAL